MSKNRLRSFLFVPFLLLLLLCACVLLLNSLIQDPAVQHYLLKKISETTGYEIKASGFDISLWGGLGITGHGVSAATPDRAETIVASSVRIGFNPYALLKGRVAVTALELDDPQVNISIQPRGIGQGPGVEGTLGEMRLLEMGGLRALSVWGGRIRMKGSPFAFQRVFLSMQRMEGRGFERSVHFRGELVFRGHTLPFHLKGSLRGDENGKGIWVDMTGASGRAPASWIPWPEFIRFSGGTFSVAFHLAGALGGTASASGTLYGHDLHFAMCKKDRKKEYVFPELPLAFQAGFHHDVLDIRVPAARLLDTSLASRITLKADTPSPRLEVTITSPFMSLKTFHALFPTSLVPAWIEKKLFPCLSNGQVKANRFSLSGTLDALSRLELPENFRALAMSVTWRNLDVLKGRFPLPFEAVSGDLDIQENRLDLSHLKGRFGSSVVSDASLRAGPLKGKPTVYHLAVKGDFALQDLIALRALPWTPMDIRKRVAELGGASGRVTALLKARKVEGTTAFPRIREATLHFKDCRLTRKSLLFPLVLRHGEMVAVESKPIRFSGSGTWGNSSLEVSGTSDWSLNRGAARITGNMDMDALAAPMTKGKTWQMNLGASVPCEVTVMKQGKAWSFEGALRAERPGLKVGSFSMNPLSRKNRIRFDVTYLPGKSLTFRDITGQLSRSQWTASGTLRFSGEPTLQVRLHTPGLFLEDLGIHVGGGYALTGGTVSGRIQATVPLNHLNAALVSGELQGERLDLTLAGLPHPVRHGRFLADFSGKAIAIRTLDFETGASALQIEGKLDGWDALRGSLSLKSDHLDTEDFRREKHGPPNEKSQSLLGHLRQEKTDLKISAQVETLQWRQMKVGPLTAVGTLRGARFRFSHCRLETEHGVITARGQIGLKKGGLTELSGHVRLIRQPARELFRDLGMKKPYLEGRLSTDMELSTTGHDKKSLIAGLNGKGDVLIQEGKVLKSNILIQIMDFLSLQKIFVTPPPDLSKKGFYFEKIGCNFTIQRGVLHTDNLMMKSPVFNAAARGNLDLVNSKVKGDLNVQPLVTLDYLVSKIPIAGYILTGKDKSLLVYYFRVKGSIASPQVSYIPLKHWGNSMMGYVARIFLTPPRLFEKLMKLLKPLENHETKDTHAP